MSSNAALAIADQIVTALKKNGVADAKVAPPDGNFIGPANFVAVAGTLRAPTFEKARALVEAVTSSMPSMTVGPQNICYVLGVDSCADLQTRATDGAIADARAYAMQVARSADVRLGGIISLNVYGGTPSACVAGMQQNGQRLAIMSRPTALPINTFEVEYSASMTLTFAIR